MLDRVTVLFNVADDAVFIDHESDAVGKQAGEIQNPVGFGHYFVRIAQQRKAGAGIFRELAIPLLGVETDSQNLRARRLKFGDIRLISFYLASSPRSGGARVKRQNHATLTMKVGQVHRLAVLIAQREVRSPFAHLQLGGFAKDRHNTDHPHQHTHH